MRLFLALLAVGAVLVCLPEPLYAWTPGTHIYLAETVLANLQLVPLHVAELLRVFPYDFLYGNIAADSSIAKKYAPVGRHCHYWHVGQEIFDLAGNDAIRAFGLGYLCHLAADTVAHNYFVPRQLVLTSSTSAVGHSYWESRIDSQLGDAYPRSARDLIRMDHSASDAHLDQIISPTIFSVRTNRRLFRGMVHLTDMPGWQMGMQAARTRSRWDLTDDVVGGYLARSLDYMLELLGEGTVTARELDPSGERPLKVAKEIRRRTIRDHGRVDHGSLLEAADEHYALPLDELQFWPQLSRRLPWRAGGAGGAASIAS